MTNLTERLAGKVISHIAYSNVWGENIIVFTDGSGVRPTGDELGIFLRLMTAEQIAAMLSLNDLSVDEQFQRTRELESFIFDELAA